jgi:hypothetical protein
MGCDHTGSVSARDRFVLTTGYDLFLGDRRWLDTGKKAGRKVKRAMHERKAYVALRAVEEEGKEPQTGYRHRTI